MMSRAGNVSRGGFDVGRGRDRLLVGAEEHTPICEVLEEDGSAGEMATEEEEDDE